MQFIITAEVILVISIVLFIIISDVVFLVRADGPLPSGLNSDTYSAVTRFWSKLTPVMPWIWGLLAGRFFHWGQSSIIEDPSWLAFLLLLAITAVFLVVFILLRKKIWQPIASSVGMPIAFVLAYIIGALFWPVNVDGIFFI
ncbi:hypothetical protein [Parasulfitobacter algicola]|uniref:Uncharacterized protein n=1 Tax=Parasulfitobacter algicola TaxID=2614809 RepID=A0ABX2IZH7_9RHOB|nr:hypothetical protein [Sulfitobacter algicola]NSX55763.1 hypothetical protein [Sulfitobacter algicola]